MNGRIIKTFSFYFFFKLLLVFVSTASWNNKRRMNIWERNLLTHTLTLTHTHTNSSTINKTFDSTSEHFCKLKILIKYLMNTTTTTHTLKAHFKCKVFGWSSSRSKLFFPVCQKNHAHYFTLSRRSRRRILRSCKVDNNKPCSKGQTHTHEKVDDCCCSTRTTETTNFDFSSDFQREVRKSVIFVKQLRYSPHTQST